MEELMLGNLFVEVTAVGIVNFIFLILFVVAGVRQMMKLKD